MFQEYAALLDSFSRIHLSLWMCSSQVKALMIRLSYRIHQTVLAYQLWFYCSCTEGFICMTEEHFFCLCRTSSNHICAEKVAPFFKVHAPGFGMAGWRSSHIQNYPILSHLHAPPSLSYVASMHIWKNTRCHPSGQEILTEMFRQDKMFFFSTWYIPPYPLTYLYKWAEHLHFLPLHRIKPEYPGCKRCHLELMMLFFEPGSRHPVNTPAYLR